MNSAPPNSAQKISPSTIDSKNSFRSRTFGESESFGKIRLLGALAREFRVSRDLIVNKFAVIIMHTSALL
jgi:hypothetical protein